MAPPSPQDEVFPLESRALTLQVYERRDEAVEDVVGVLKDMPDPAMEQEQSS